jgi:hypothetical protein
MTRFSSRVTPFELPESRQVCRLVGLTRLLQSGKVEIRERGKWERHEWDLRFPLHK